MFKKINERLLKFVAACSKPSHLILLFLAFLGVNIFVLGPIQEQLMALSGGVGVIDLLPWYSPDEAFQRLNVYGEEGRKLYLIAEWTGDLIYPLIYSLFFSGILYRLGGGEWALLSVYSATIDWLENAAITVMLLLFPTFYEGVAHIAGFLTVAKWALAVCNVMMVIVFGSRSIIQWFKNRK